MQFLTKWTDAESYQRFHIVSEAEWKRLKASEIVTTCLMPWTHNLIIRWSRKRLFTCTRTVVLPTGYLLHTFIYSYVFHLRPTTGALASQIGALLSTAISLDVPLRVHKARTNVMSNSTWMHVSMSRSLLPLACLSCSLHMMYLFSSYLEKVRLMCEIGACTVACFK